MYLLNQSIYGQLAKRIGRENLSRRLKIQVAHSASIYGHGTKKLHLENFPGIRNILRGGLRMLCLLERGRRNTLDFRVEQVTTKLPGLPKSFKGLKILHLSDLHSDAFLDKGKRLKQIIAGLEFDICVVTGDYRFKTHGPYQEAVDITKDILSVISPRLGIFGVLGNHDFIEFVPILERSGVKMLLNESETIELGGEYIQIAGVDDPNYYGGHDLKRALTNRTDGRFTILLSHAPGIYQQAFEHRVNFYLCGHTHGGQICMPGRIPFTTNAACPRRMASGKWTFKGMRGYTSRGAGSSVAMVRYNCPPEVTVHTLMDAPRKKGLRPLNH